GKTFPALVAADTFDSSKTTIWLLPMRSMKEQFIARFREHNMNYGVWPLSGQHSDIPTHILIHIDSVYVNPEQHASFRQRFSAFLNRFRPQISRFVVDEAHLLMTHDSFRQ